MTPEAKTIVAGTARHLEEHLSPKAGREKLLREIAEAASRGDIPAIKAITAKIEERDGLRAKLQLAFGSVFEVLEEFGVGNVDLPELTSIAIARAVPTTESVKESKYIPNARAIALIGIYELIQGEEEGDLSSVARKILLPKKQDDNSLKRAEDLVRYYKKDFLATILDLCKVRGIDRIGNAIDELIIDERRTAGNEPLVKFYRLFRTAYGDCSVREIRKLFDLRRRRKRMPEKGPVSVKKEIEEEDLRPVEVRIGSCFQDARVLAEVNRLIGKEVKTIALEKGIVRQDQDLWELLKASRNFCAPGRPFSKEEEKLIGGIIGRIISGAEVKIDSRFINLTLFSLIVTEARNLKVVDELKSVFFHCPAVVVDISTGVVIGKKE